MESLILDDVSRCNNLNCKIRMSCKRYRQLAIDEVLRPRAIVTEFYPSENECIGFIDLKKMTNKLNKMEKFKILIGLKIKEALKKEKITVIQKDHGISVSRIYAIISGRENYSIDLLLSVAKVLGVDLADDYTKLEKDIILGVVIHSCEEHLILKTEYGEIHVEYLVKTEEEEVESNDNYPCSKTTCYATISRIEEYCKKSNRYLNITEIFDLKKMELDIENHLRNG